MSNNSVYTRRIKGLDRKVWVVMILTIVLSLGLLSYTVFNKKVCTPVDFVIKVLPGESSDSVYFVGETLIFNSSSTATDISWDFSDGSEQAIGKDVSHKFQTEGDYIITVSTGLGCETARRITIKKAIQPEAKPFANYTTGGEIEGPAKIMTGREARFICIVSADHYEWSIENYPQMTRTGPTPKFIFPRPGKYLVQVMLDNDRNKRFGKEIEVEEVEIVDGSKPKRLLPKDTDAFKPYDPPQHETVKVEQVAKPAADTPVVVAAPANKSIYVADRVFLNYLEKVVSKEMTVADFDKYLCGGGGTPVVVNGDQKSPKTFAWLCNELSAKKKKLVIFNKTIKIESAQLHRINGCVTLIDVKY